VWSKAIAPELRYPAIYEGFTVGEESRNGKKTRLQHEGTYRIWDDGNEL
jgi:hypothetical protein